MAWTLIGSTKLTIGGNGNNLGTAGAYFHFDDINLIKKAGAKALLIVTADYDGKNCHGIIGCTGLTTNGGQPMAGAHDIIALGCPPITDTDGGQELP